MNRFIHFMVLCFSVSCLFSNYTGASHDQPFTFQKEKSKGVIKASNNTDLKVELLELEERFKDDHDRIKADYREKISSLKEMQKSEVQSLKANYNERRKAIYKKYGIKPPKPSNNESGMQNSDLFKPNDRRKKDSVKRLSLIKKSKK